MPTAQDRPTKPSPAGCRSGCLAVSAACLKEQKAVPISTILFVLAILMMLGTVLMLPDSHSWGAGPSGAIGTIAIVAFVFVVLGRL